MKVSELMTWPAVCVAEDDTIKRAADLMVHAAVGALPVVDGSGRLVGIVSESDLVRRQAFGSGEALGPLSWLRHPERRVAAARRGDRVADIMSRELMVAAPDEDVRAVARRIVEQRLRHMPVVDGTTVVGMLAAADLVRLFHRADAAIQADATASLADLPPTMNAELTATVADGVVGITGAVELPSDRDIVQRRLWAVAGVIDVKDESTARRAEPFLLPPII